MCADFVAPQFQNPDFLGSYIRGQQSGMQAAAFPGQMQLQGQQVQSGQLNLDMLRQMMQLRSQAYQDYRQTMGGFSQPSGTQSTQTGNQPGAPTAGIENGPQASVSGDSQPAAESPNPLAPYLDPRRIAGNAALGSFNAFLNGKDPNEPISAGLKLEGEARDYQLKSAQIRSQLQGSPLSVLQAFSSNPNAGAALTKNPQMFSQWTQIAQKYGLDPQDLSNINVQMGATMAANEARRALQLPPLPMPVGYRDVNGPYGEHGQVQIGGETPGKETEVTAQKPPSYSPEVGYNPKTGQKSVSLLQTSPGGLQSGFGGPSAGGPQAGGGVGSVRPPTDIGYTAPGAPETKAAMFASEMRAGLNTLNKMETNGFTLSPKTRTLLINAATSEDEGVMRQFLSQEALTHMSKDEQTYISALMPMLQAAGHDQSGARLTTSQVRQNIESLLPIDVKNREALDQVRQNRQGFYVGLLGQAGSAIQLPQYKGTLGSDLQNAQEPAATKTIGNATYVKRNGKWYHK
jgi:hypothetical protein